MRTPLLYLQNGWTDCAEIWHVASGQLVLWLPHVYGGVTMHVHPSLLYLGNGWTDCADIWHVGSDQLVMRLQHAHGVSLCTWARAHPGSISWERLNWLCSNLLREQRPIWYLCGFDKAMGVSVHVRNCTLRLFLGSWIGWFKVDDCGISGGNFQPTWHVHVMLLCDTSFALALSSPTRRYTVAILIT